MNKLEKKTLPTYAIELLHCLGPLFLKLKKKLRIPKTWPKPNVHLLSHLDWDTNHIKF